MKRIVCQSAIVLCAVAFSQENPVAPPAFEMFYTGRLLGHARVPDRQTDQQHSLAPCPAWDADPKNPKVSAIADSLKRQLNSLGYVPPKSGQSLRPLLASLGDTFAPEYEARMVTLGHETVPKDLLIWHNNQWMDITTMSQEDLTHYSKSVERPGKAIVGFDNVACYLSWLGYSVLVPGKHDLHFGAERFRQYAHLLNVSGIRTLAPNLHVVTTDTKPPAPLPGRHQERFLMNGTERKPYTTIDSEVSIKLPRTVYPWFLNVSVSGLFRFEALEPGSKSVRLRDDQVADQRAEGAVVTTKALANRLRVCPALNGQIANLDESRCDSINITLPPNPDPKAALVEWEIPKQFRERGKSYGVCVDWNPEFSRVDAKNPRLMPLCSLYTVVQPLLRYEPWQGIDSQPPYYVHHGPQGNIAVFGIVGSFLAETVSRIDLSWRNVSTRGSFETSLSVADEVETLEQALRACAKDTECNTAPFKVLLAQMTEERAGALVKRAKGKFDAVLSEANVRGSTPAQTVVRKLDDQKARTVVHSPGPVLGDDLEHLTPQVQRIRIYRKQDRIELEHEVNICAPPACTIPYESPETLMLDRQERIRLANVIPNHSSAKPPSLIRRVRDILKRDFKIPDAESDKWTDVEAVHRLILESLRRHQSTDVAMIQKRDAFRLTKSVLQSDFARKELMELFERILWKGDFLLDIGVKGSVLKEVMDQSKILARQDTDLSRTDTERERGLLTIGVEFDPETQQWMVNGAALDADRLYSVSMPDYMAFGDTGYGALKKPDGQNAPRLRRWHELKKLASIPCRTMADGSAQACGDKTLDAADYQDNLKLNPPNLLGKPGPGARAWSWLLSGLVPHDPLRLANALERRVQQRQVWSITLDKLQFGYNFYLHNGGTEKEVRSRFAGLSSPQQVFSPETNTFNSAFRLRTARTYGPGDLFLLTDAALQRVKTRDANNVYIPDVRGNTLGFEGGWNPRLGYRGIRSPEWLGIFSLRWEGNIQNPTTSVTVGVTPLREQIARTPTLVAKTGIRWAGKVSWLETGFMFGRRYNVPIGFAVEKAGNIAALIAAGRDSSGRIRPPRSGLYCATTVIGQGLGPAPAQSASNDDKLAYADTLPFADCVKVKAEALNINQNANTVESYGLLGDYRDRPRVGNFLNFRFQIPLPGLKGHFYVMENTGEFLNNTGQDLPLETRIQNVWTNGLQLALWKNVSVVPKVEYFYFRNKVQGLSLSGITSRIDFQYRFDWRPGLWWQDTRKFPYPAAAK